ncbi:hypothetical protein ECANGB1_680 [Enterospora canceri]|uniref:Uncharacterized protein n=1 Tax=Enterospora canceri TaxID=1081671 RepID=A0A1Y1S8G1_9MICR|nr:hypothetical protein ECANGB1_680 [Enterospora canceri]
MFICLYFLTHVCSYNLKFTLEDIENHRNKTRAELRRIDDKMMTNQLENQEHKIVAIKERIEISRLKTEFMKSESEHAEGKLTKEELNSIREQHEKEEFSHVSLKMYYDSQALLLDCAMTDLLDMKEVLLEVMLKEDTMEQLLLLVQVHHRDIDHRQLKSIQKEIKKYMKLFEQENDQLKAFQDKSPDFLCTREHHKHKYIPDFYLAFYKSVYIDDLKEDLMDILTLLGRSLLGVEEKLTFCKKHFKKNTQREQKDKKSDSQPE